MKKDIHVKPVTNQSGKKKFQAQVWHKGVFYAAQTFDSQAAAKEYKQQTQLRVLRGELPPASERKANRQIEASLNTSMGQLAENYIEKYGAENHCANRVGDYRKVGRLLSHLPLRHFSGVQGARRLHELMKQWKASGRLPRSKADQASSDFKGAPLSDQEVRLRLSATLRIIKHAKSTLPENCPFEVPNLKEAVFDFKMPPAHQTKRTRQPSDDEYVQLIKHFGLHTEEGQLIFLLDETGCRLGEISHAHAENLHIYKEGAKVVGGHLHLPKHKTAKKTGKARDVPLSRHAADLLHQRKLLVGSGRLFPGLSNANTTCKTFSTGVSACDANDLTLKDFRRAFINRNKYQASALDLYSLFGESSVLADAGVTAQATQKAAGHTDLRTTGGYNVVDLEQMCAIFTSTSRAHLVLDAPLTIAANDADVARRIAAVEAEMQAQIAKLQAMCHSQQTM